VELCYGLFTCVAGVHAGELRKCTLDSLSFEVMLFLFLFFVLLVVSPFILSNDRSSFKVSLSLIHGFEKYCILDRYLGRVGDNIIVLLAWLFELD